MSRYGTRRALSEMAAIISCQWANGMLPQIRFAPGSYDYRPDARDWGVMPEVSGPTELLTSGITQPPIMGLCALEIYRKMDAEERTTHRLEMIGICEGIAKYHEWFFRERDPWGEKLVLCLHPWETGTDNSPAFDPLIEQTRDYLGKSNLPVDLFGRADTRHVTGEHRPTDKDYQAYFGLVALMKQHDYNQKEVIAHTPFLLQDVLFNTLLVASLRALSKLQMEIGVEEGSPGNSDLAEEVAAAIRRKLWDEADGLFYSYDCRSERLLRTPTVSSLVPMLGVATDKEARRLLERLSDKRQFWTEVPVPSTAANNEAFNPVRYWSGPSWPVTNWLVILGLRDYDRDMAEWLRRRTLEVIREGASPEAARSAAERLLLSNSINGRFTTPSRQQYSHAWLWDSAIVAASWPLVTGAGEVQEPQEGDPGFWEYYHPHTGAPLGARNMTWTASLYIELSEMNLDE